MSFKKISVIGLGYIGLPTAAIMASRGMEVEGVDVNQLTVDTINAGKVHIVEPDLDIVVSAVVATGKLRASSVAQSSDAFLIAVPTPLSEINEEQYRPDLSYIKAAADTIAPVLEKGNLVVLESTSPVGTTERLSEWLSLARPDLSFPQAENEQADINIAYCPERVLPGAILRELVSNDRIIGGMSRECSDRAAELYKTFVQGKCIITDARTAEMTKLTENAFRDVNIAFANELSIMCDKLNVNVWELIKLANRHPRVNILNPGPGVGGHCIAIDPWFLVDSCPGEANLIRKAREINDAKPQFVIEKIMKQAALVEKPMIACLGLTYKADVDDLRESPALGIVEILSRELPESVMVVEPNIKQLPRSLLKNGAMLEALSNAINKANIIVLLVDHAEFVKVNLLVLEGKTIIDTIGFCENYQAELNFN